MLLSASIKISLSPYRITVEDSEYKVETLRFPDVDLTLLVCRGIAYSKSPNRDRRFAKLLEGKSSLLNYLTISVYV